MAFQKRTEEEVSEHYRRLARIDNWQAKERALTALSRRYGFVLRADTSDYDVYEVTVEDMADAEASGYYEINESDFLEFKTK